MRATILVLILVVCLLLWGIVFGMMFGVLDVQAKQHGPPHWCCQAKVCRVCPTPVPYWPYP